MMRLWTMFLSLLFGYLILGPIGAAFGLLLGHFFTNSFNRLVNFQNRVQIFYFKALFLILGKLCKADGHISQAEIKATEQLFAEMDLSVEAKKQAIAYFKQGQADDFELDEILKELHLLCLQQTGLLRLFVQTLFKVAIVDGLDASKEALLEHICNQLGFQTKFYYEQNEYTRSDSNKNKHYTHQHHPHSLENDYALLEVSSDVSMQELKKAYRRLMSQHHPDKLIAKGLPESMIKIATRKTQEIQAAYERIKRSKGI